MLQHFARFQANFAQLRLAVESGAFVEKPVMVDKSLGKCSGIMRVVANNLEGVFRRLRQPRGTAGR